MSQLLDLICSPPMSTTTTPALASFPVLIPSPSGPVPSPTSTASSQQLDGTALRARPHVDLSTNTLAKQDGEHASPVLNDEAQPGSPAASIPLATDLTMAPIEALSAIDYAGATGMESAQMDDMVLSDAAQAGSEGGTGQADPLQIKSEVRPPALRTRISISETSPSGTFSPPGISPTDPTVPPLPNHITLSRPPRLPPIVASEIDSLPIPILALPTTSTADRVRPQILARASHSDAITSTTTYTAAQNGFGASLDVTLGSPTVDVARRTSLTFKDAVGRRMGRGSCPEPTTAVREQAGGVNQNGNTPYNTPDKYPHVGMKRDPTSPLLVSSGQGVLRRPSWKITLPPLPALSAVSAGMERLAVSDDSTAGSEASRLLTDDAVQQDGMAMLGLGVDENVARRTVYNRTPYPMSEEEENVDPFTAFAGAGAMVHAKEAKYVGVTCDVGLKRFDLSALHPSDRQHGPDFDAKIGGDGDTDMDSEDEKIYATSSGNVRASLLKSSANNHSSSESKTKTQDEDDIEFIDPFSGSRISVKEANSQILSDSVRLRPGNPVLVRKSSFGALGGASTSSDPADRHNSGIVGASPGDSIGVENSKTGTLAKGQYGQVAVSGLPGTTSRPSRIAAFFSRSRTPSAASGAPAAALPLSSAAHSGTPTDRGVSATSKECRADVGGSGSVKQQREPVVADAEIWGSTGMSNQWSNDSQSALEGDGLLV